MQASLTRTPVAAARPGRRARAAAAPRAGEWSGVVSGKPCRPLPPSRNSNPDAPAHCALWSVANAAGGLQAADCRQRSKKDAARQALRFGTNADPLSPPSLSLHPDAAAAAETAEQMLARASSSGTRVDGRAFRRSLGKTGRYVRNPTNDDTALALMEEHGVGYSSVGLVAQVRE